MSDTQHLSSMIAVAKAQLWEEAKGKLRAMIAVEGQCSGSAPEHQHHRERWRDLGAAIEAFISQTEGAGLHE